MNRRAITRRNDPLSTRQNEKKHCRWRKFTRKNDRARQARRTGSAGLTLGGRSLSAPPQGPGGPYTEIRILRYHIDSMQVPLLDVRRQNEPIESEILAAFQRVLRSGQFILGNESSNLSALPRL